MPRHHRGWAMNGHEGSYQVRHTPLTVSLLEPALLCLLKFTPRHGYTLLSDLEVLGMGSLHPSVVYRTLREMEDLGWVQSTWDADQTQGPPRRTYSLTDTGGEIWQKWQEELRKARELITHLLEKNQ